MKVNGSTQLLGILGNPLSHTASPAMHNSVCQQLKVNYIYVPIHITNDDLENSLTSLKRLNYKGFNVTIPYKESILPFLDKIDTKAKRLGAVNTVVNENDQWVGYNTDGQGFLEALEKESNFQVENTRVCIIGAGGSARAIADTLLEEKIESLVIINRTIEKARLLADTLKTNFTQRIEIKSITDPSLSMSLNDSHLIINATSLGMYPNQHTCPLNDFSWIKKTHFLYDLIYNPEETLFLNEAYKIGAPHLSGTGMLAGQGYLAFEYFTQTKAPYELFRAALEDFFS
ncbi:MAG: shikimate dehydrogenase [bacterium]